MLLVAVLTSPLTPLQPIAPYKTSFCLAGEGSVIERGLCPLFKSLPPSPNGITRNYPLLCLERGIRG